jgi:hypothetical protein
MRAVKNNLPTPSGEVGEPEGPRLGQGAFLGEEAVLAGSGREGAVAARDGRVKSLAFLSSL